MYDYLDLRQTKRLKELVPYKALAPDADEIIEELDRLNNIIKELSKDVDMWNKKYNEQFNIINELENWLKQRYKKTEENSSRMTDITYLNREFYITVKNVQSDRKDILDKLKELKENNK